MTAEGAKSKFTVSTSMTSARRPGTERAGMFAWSPTRSSLGHGVAASPDFKISRCPYIQRTRRRRRRPTWFEAPQKPLRRCSTARRRTYRCSGPTGPDSKAIRASICAPAVPPLVATTRTVRTSFSMAPPPTKCICSCMTRDNSTAAYPRPPGLFPRQNDISFPSRLVPCRARRFLQEGHGLFSTATARRPQACF